MALPAGFCDGLCRTDCFANSESSNAVQITHSYQSPVLDLHATLHRLREVQCSRTDNGIQYSSPHYLTVNSVLEGVCAPNSPAVGNNTVSNRHSRFGTLGC